jgi:hypothetical protein
MDKALKSERDQILQTLSNVAGLIPLDAQRDLNEQLKKLANHILKVRETYDRTPLKPSP